MKFIHIQNVSVERRFVVQKNGQTRAAEEVNKQNFKGFVENLRGFRQVTNNQKMLLVDTNNTLETVDKMSAFSFNPPELLCISNVKIFYKFFIAEKKFIRN